MGNKQQPPAFFCTEENYITVYDSQLQTLYQQDAPGKYHNTVMLNTRTLFCQCNGSCYTFNVYSRRWKKLTLNVAQYGNFHKLTVYRLTTTTVCLVLPECAIVYNAIDDKLAGTIVLASKISVIPVNHNTFAIHNLSTNTIAMWYLQPTIAKFSEYEIPFLMYSNDKVQYLVHHSRVCICKEDHFVVVFDYVTNKTVFLREDNFFSPQFYDKYFTCIVTRFNSNSVYESSIHVYDNVNFYLIKIIDDRLQRSEYKHMYKDIVVCSGTEVAFVNIVPIGESMGSVVTANISQQVLYKLVPLDNDRLYMPLFSYQEENGLIYSRSKSTLVECSQFLPNIQVLHQIWEPQVYQKSYFETSERMYFCDLEFIE